MDKWIKAGIAVLVLGVIAFFGYQLLPSMGKNFLEGKYQMLTNKEAKAAITSVQNAKIKDFNDYTYKTVLEDMCGDYYWLYQDDADGYTVTFEGNRAAFVMTEDSKDMNVTTNSMVKCVFKVNDNGNFSYELYIDGDKQNKASRKEYMRKMVNNHETGTAK